MKQHSIQFPMYNKWTIISIVSYSFFDIIKTNILWNIYDYILSKNLKRYIMASDFFLNEMKSTCHIERCFRFYKYYLATDEHV